MTRITLAAQPSLQAIHMRCGGFFPEGALCRHHQGLGDGKSDAFNFWCNVAGHGLNMMRLARGAGTKLQLDRGR